MIRLQQVALQRGDKAVIMGSSMTERLFPSRHIKVIAVPGSPFTSAMSVATEAGVTLPKLVIIEVNMLFNPDNTEILHKTREWRFRTFRNSKHFSIAARPSSLLYSLGFSYASRHHFSPESEDLFPCEITAPCNLADAKPWNEEQRRTYAEIVQAIDQLKADGRDVVLAYFPTRQMGIHMNSFKLAKGLAKELNIPLLNYSDAPFLPALRFSDSHHLVSSEKTTILFRNTLVRDAMSACGMELQQATPLNPKSI